MDAARGCCCRSDHLTLKEVAAVELIALGLANDAIGARLSLSGHTVAGQISAAMRRLRAHNRAELVARCYAEGILDASVWPPHATGRRCVSRWWAPGTERAVEEIR
jgi:DNA-binding CsgD family transcriptional regulator